MTTEEQFRAELTALLNKYNADLSAEDHYPGYPECGEDIRITVYIPTTYANDGTLIREGCEIDLGKQLVPEDKAGVRLILREEHRFCCGQTSFTCLPGKVVHIRQRNDDSYGDRVLLDFGDGQIDWFNKIILGLFDSTDS